MAYEDLEAHNIFLPEEHWGELDLSTSVNQTYLVVSFVLGVVSCVLMVLGGGGTLTWIGGLLFVLFMFLFTWVSNAGIDRQNEVVDEVMGKRRTQ